jgi:hypothetical protein
LVELSPVKTTSMIKPPPWNHESSQKVKNKVREKLYQSELAEKLLTVFPYSCGCTVGCFSGNSCCGCIKKDLKCNSVASAAPSPNVL